MEIGKIGKKILSKAIEKLKVRTGLKLWKNTQSVLDWFNRLENKNNLRFVGFDIQDYYTSISEDLFKEALEWASSIVEFSDEEIEVIMESKRTLLYDGHHLWKKKGAAATASLISTPRPTPHHTSLPPRCMHHSVPPLFP